MEPAPRRAALAALAACILPLVAASSRPADADILPSFHNAAGLTQLPCEHGLDICNVSTHFERCAASEGGQGASRCRPVCPVAAPTHGALPTAHAKPSSFNRRQLFLHAFTVCAQAGGYVCGGPERPAGDSTVQQAARLVAATAGGSSGPSASVHLGGCSRGGHLDSAATELLRAVAGVRGRGEGTGMLCCMGCCTNAMRRCCGSP